MPLVIIMIIIIIIIIIRIRRRRRRRRIVIIIIIIATCVDDTKILVMHLLEIRSNLHRCGVELGTVSIVTQLRVYCSCAIHIHSTVET